MLEKLTLKQCGLCFLTLFHSTFIQGEVPPIETTIEVPVEVPTEQIIEAAEKETTEVPAEGIIFQFLLVQIF